MAADQVVMHNDTLGASHFFPNRDDVIAYWQSRGWFVVPDTTPAAASSTAVVFVHGDASGATRPTTDGPVVWVGAAQPTQLDPARDVWAPTVPTTV